MTTQIEQHPRPGVELATPSNVPSVRSEVMAFLLCMLGMAVMAEAIVSRNPVIAAVACLVASAGYLVGHILECCRHGD